MLSNYFLASSPQSSSSSLSEAATLTHESGLNSHGSSRNGSAASSPVGHGSSTGTTMSSTSSLPHKLRHKLQTTSTRNDCEASLVENGLVVMRQVLPSNSLGERDLEENSVEGRGSSTGKGTESLKEENYTLRNELQRLATEVASLKTILLPVSPSSSA